MGFLTPLQGFNTFNMKDPIMRAINPKVMPVVFLLGVGCIGLENPQSAMADEGCSNATLKGVYLFSQSGTQIKDSKQIPFASAGLDRFNGNGAVSGINTTVTGRSVQRNVPYAGSCMVNEDCTGTCTTTTTDGTDMTINYDLFIAPSGDEFTYIVTDKGSVTTALEHRVVPQRPAGGDATGRGERVKP